MSRPGLPFVVAAALLLGAPSAVAGQVERVSPVLQLSGLDVRDGLYRYQYRVVGYAGGGQKISDVYLDIRTPTGERAPGLPRARGDLLFDALHDFHGELPYAHALEFIATPERWSAAIYRQGVLSWGASRYLDGPNHGVETGRVLDGFEVHSRALPALRRFRGVPYRRPALVEEAQEDDDLVLHSGYVLAPGWMAEDVSGAFLRQQVEAACAATLLDNCGRYLRLSDAVLNAEAGMDSRAFAAALARFRQHLREDKVSHRNARFVLERAVVALAE